MEYWKCCIEEAFDDLCIEATKDQIAGVIEWVEGASENMSMATGSDCIPNPMCSEVDDLKAKLVKQEIAYERQLNGIAKWVARRRNTSVSDVFIDADGLVTYR